VCAAFDVSDPFKPGFIAQIPLGDLNLPSGRLRNKKSVSAWILLVRPPRERPIAWQKAPLYGMARPSPPP
jgi:hypothetical protein